MTSKTKIKFIETLFRKFLQGLTILGVILHEFVALHELEIMYQNKLLLTFFCKLDNEILSDTWKQLSSEGF